MLIKHHRFVVIEKMGWILTVLMKCGSFICIYVIKIHYFIIKNHTIKLYNRNYFWGGNNTKNEIAFIRLWQNLKRNLSVCSQGYSVFEELKIWERYWIRSKILCLDCWNKRFVCCWRSWKVLIVLQAWLQ